MKAGATIGKKRHNFKHVQGIDENEEGKETLMFLLYYLGPLPKALVQVLTLAEVQARALAEVQALRRALAEVLM